MGDEVSTIQNLTSLALSVYAENKVILSFIGGAITFGIPHGYKLYKLYSDRQDLKDKIREVLIEEAHKNRTVLQNATDVISEMTLKSMSGLYYDSLGAMSLYLSGIQRTKVRPAIEEAEKLYGAVSGSDSLSLKELKSYMLKAKKSKYANELMLTEIQVRLREFGAQAKLVG